VEKNAFRGSAGPARVAVLVLALALALLLGVAASAQEPTWIDFASVGHELRFAESVTFTLEAEASHPPERLWLVYRLEGERANNLGLAVFSGDRQVEASWVWVIEPGQISPGATLYYRWAAEDAEGNRVESEESSFEYTDPRFDWQVLEQGMLSVNYYRDEKVGRQVLRAGTEALDKLDGNTGEEATEPISVYVYANEEDMSSAIPMRSEGFDARTVTLGMTMDETTLVLLSSGDDIVGTTAHELSHIVVSQAMADNPFADVPRWLDEGLAMYAEGAMPSGNQRALEKAIAEDRVLSLRSMTSYPGEADLIDLFYGEAYSLVDYLLSNYGADAMHTLLATLSEGVPIEEALPEAHGLTLAELEQGWRSSVGLQPATSATAAAATAALADQEKPSPAPTRAAAGGEVGGGQEKQPEGGGRAGRGLPCAGVALLPVAAVLFVGRSYRRHAT